MSNRLPDKELPKRGRPRLVCLDPEGLRASYESGASIRAVARELNVSSSTVIRWLKQHGVEIRRKLKRPTKSLLARMYWEEGLSTAEIARRTGTTNAGVVHNWMTKYGIPQHRAGRPIGFDLDAHRHYRLMALLDLYLEALPAGEIAERLALDEEEVRHWVTEYGNLT